MTIRPIQGGWLEMGEHNSVLNWGVLHRHGSEPGGPGGPVAAAGGAFLVNFLDLNDNGRAIGVEV
ncbi:MAG: hypothetical protein FJ054_13850 [Cyanobacteria bacterium M_surface_10_m2_119]|nr:hypothetical protein [Cyanobacteria bacterium K_DeepCast_35m_m1_288]MBM5796841.1 hypothetical protein [Cyanobacteria bacterium K_Offshore_0m_m2_072]MBM5826402.1 hypothetical protein [Cyanobacteria bacterium M_surface_10_m2_119]